MAFTSTLKKNTDGDLYLEIPDELGWRPDDLLEVTVMTDLDTDQPAVLIVNVTDRERKNAQSK